MDDRFGRAAPFAIGVEEELPLVDAGTGALAHVSSRLVPELDAPAGAQRMRAAHAEGGMARVVERLVAESAEPLEVT